MADLRKSGAWVVGILGLLCAAAGAGAGEVNAALPTLFLVGNADAALGRELPSLFDGSKINVVDRSEAASGERSTLEDGSWAKTLAMMRAGDFVLIDFRRAGGGSGALDSLPGVGDDWSSDTGAATATGNNVVRSYGWYLRRFAVEAIARGATPLLCASAVADTSEQGSEQVWTRAIAVQQRIPFVDAVAAGQASPEIASDAAKAVVAGLKGLTQDPLRGYFSAGGVAVPAFRAPAPPPEPRL